MTFSIEIFMIEGSKLNGMLENFPLKCTKFVLDLYFLTHIFESLRMRDEIENEISHNKIESRD